MRRFIATVCLFVFLFSISTVPLHAQIPKLITYQGLLKDANNNYLTGTYSMKFRIYDAETLGNLLWSETQSSVSVSSGRFSVQLGKVTSLDLPFDKDYWLSVEVGTDGEMSPRQRLTTVPYSQRAQVAETVVNSFTQTQHDALSHKNIEGVKANTTNIAKTNFKLDAYTKASANNMGDMVVDTFNDSTGIDSAKSTKYTHRGSPNYDVIVASGKVVVHPSDYATGLQGYWKMDEASGTRNDSTANGNHLSMVNGTVSSGTGAKGDTTNYSNSGDFPNTNDVGLERSDASSVGLEPKGAGGSFSIAFWVYVRNFVSGTRPMVSKSHGSGPSYATSFNVSATLDLYLNGSKYTTSSSFSTSTWYHVGIVFDEPNDKLTVYRNGTELQAWTGVTTQLGDSTWPFMVGRHTSWNGADSLIDDVAFWNNVQSSTTFDELYNGKTKPLGDADVKSVTFSESKVPKEAMVVAEETPGTGSLTYYVSRDDGVTWTECPKEKVVDISAQPSGSKVRWRAVIKGDAELDGIAVAI